MAAKDRKDRKKKEGVQEFKELQEFRTSGLLVPLFLKAGSDLAGSFSCRKCVFGFEAGAEIERAFAGVSDRLNNGVAYQRNFFR